MRFTLFVSICFIPTFAGLTAESQLRLAGIVNLPGYTRAILVDSKPPGGYVLGEGERDGEIEVKEISPVDLTVTLAQHAGSSLKLTMAANTNTSANATNSITLDNADFRSVLWIFQKLCERTVLEYPQTPHPSFTFRSTTVNKLDAIHDIQIAFTNKGIVMMPDGEKFLMIGPESAASNLTSHPAQAKSAGTNSNLQSTKAESHTEELIPAGTLDFRGADLSQVFDLYGMLMGHPMDRSHGIQGSERNGLYLLNQTPLSKAEAIYAIGTLINWRGVKVVTQLDGTITGLSSRK